MEVEEVENHCLHSIDEHIAVEVVLWLTEPLDDDGKVVGTLLLLYRREPHDGVLEERQVSSRAVVALRGGYLNEFLCDVNDIHLEVATLHKVGQQFATAGNDETVARLETKRLVVVVEGAMPLMAVGMAQIATELPIADSS